MGWQERQYRPPADEGGFRRALRRILGEGGSFFDWALPLFTVAGIRVRLHLFFIIYIAIELIRSMNGTGLAYASIRLGTLFGLVLLHEFGHCIACRKVGGEANEIVMWPLGGLAMCNPPHNPRAALITTLGGPAVNFFLIPIFGLLLFLAGVPSGAIFFNPFNPTLDVSGLASANNVIFYAKFALLSAHLVNFYLFCFNMLLPMFPMDAGRVVQEACWFRMGYRRSMMVAVNLGLAMAVLVGIYAFTIGRGQQGLFAIAVFCGFTCWQERMRLSMMDDGVPGYDFSRGYAGMPGAGEARRAKPVRKGPTKAEIKQKEEEASTLAEVDRILEKIRTEGMGSLTKREKAVLRGETERKRRQAAEN